MLEQRAATGSADAPTRRASAAIAAGRRRARRPTMIDVANEARVSQTTVSLVLNHADGARLSPETRERVIKAAAKLGYQQVRRGGAPAASTATTIGFVCDELSTDPWTAIGLDGVREKAWAHGLTVTVMATRGDADMEAAALAQLAELPLAGLVYATINTRLIEAPAWASPAPIVLLNCHAPGGALPSVAPGEVAGGHAATDVLIRAGHRRIGYINGETSMEAARQRLRGYRQALATADLPFDPDLVREGNWQPLSGYDATRSLMALQGAADRDLLRQRHDGGRLLRGAARTRAQNPGRRGGDGLRRPRDRPAPASAADHRAAAAFRDGRDRRRMADRRGRGPRGAAAADQGRVPDRDAEVGLGLSVFPSTGALEARSLTAFAAL